MTAPGRKGEWEYPFWELEVMMRGKQADFDFGGFAVLAQQMDAVYRIAFLHWGCAAS